MSIRVKNEESLRRAYCACDGDWNEVMEDEPSMSGGLGRVSWLGFIASSHWHERLMLSHGLKERVCDQRAYGITPKVNRHSNEHLDRAVRGRKLCAIPLCHFQHIVYSPWMAAGIPPFQSAPLLKIPLSEGVCHLTALVITAQHTLPLSRVTGSLGVIVHGQPAPIWSV